jgi:ABC-type transport system involved in multi-copper enzyme maturation permease subunit
MNVTQYWSQIRAVIRLEMRKTFFARRGLWVYLLALAPVLLFGGHAIDMMRTREDRHALARAHPVLTSALRSIKPGMTQDEVIAAVGEPYRRINVGGRRRIRTFFSYTDGESQYTFGFLDDELQSISIRDTGNLQQDKLIFATAFQFFFLRLAIFFGCVGIFMNLFRGELIDKSLHYYLLAPIRREVLLVGKYLAGLIATVVIFTTSTALQFWMLLIPYDSATTSQYLQSGGWSHLVSYMGVTALACLGYGSVFLAAGLFFRNPLIPAGIVLVWESANLFLPAALKKISVIFYLQSLCPVVAPPDRDMNQFLALLISSAEPTPAVWAVTGLFVVTAVILVLAARQARKLEINYGTD